MTIKLRWKGCAPSPQGREEDDRCAQAAEPHNLFMRGKVTANQTQTQANQQIAPSARHSGPCAAAWIEITDGQQRKYDRKSPAADSYLNPAHIEAAGRFPPSREQFTCSAVL